MLRNALRLALQRMEAVWAVRINCVCLYAIAEVHDLAALCALMALKHS